MSYKQLTEHERYQIYALSKTEYTQKQIAEQLKKSPSTICRELKRNKGERGYRPAQAQRLTDERRVQAYKAYKLTTEVKGWIDTLLRQELSPQQVVCYLLEHKDVSLHHETIYQYVYENKYQGGDLYTHLRIISK